MRKYPSPAAFFRPGASTGSTEHGGVAAIEKTSIAINSILVTMGTALKSAPDVPVPAPGFVSHLVELSHDLANAAMDAAEGEASCDRAPGFLYAQACRVRDAVGTLHAALPDDSASCALPARNLMAHTHWLANDLVQRLERQAPDAHGGWPDD
ncbi:MAG: hypothetical protein AB7E12_13550 [Burkholderiaceae bacterium]